MKLRSPKLMLAVFTSLALVLAAAAFAANGSTSTPAGPDVFKANSNGTVLDTTTGRMWTATASQAMVYDDAVSYCAGLTLAKQHDWRLPSIYELQRLIAYDSSRGRIPASLFTIPADNQWQNGYYGVWSATPSDPGTRWVVQTFNDMAPVQATGSTNPTVDTLCIR